MRSIVFSSSYYLIITFLQYDIIGGFCCFALENHKRIGFRVDTRTEKVVKLNQKMNSWEWNEIFNYPRKFFVHVNETVPWSPWFHLNSQGIHSTREFNCVFSLSLVLLTLYPRPETLLLRLDPYLERVLVVFFFFFFILRRIVIKASRLFWLLLISLKSSESLRFLPRISSSLAFFFVFLLRFVCVCVFFTLSEPSLSHDLIAIDVSVLVRGVCVCMCVLSRKLRALDLSITIQMTIALCIFNSSGKVWTIGGG